MEAATLQNVTIRAKNKDILQSVKCEEHRLNKSKGNRTGLYMCYHMYRNGIQADATMNRLKAILQKVDDLSTSGSCEQMNWKAAYYRELV